MTNLGGKKRRMIGIASPPGKAGSGAFLCWARRRPDAFAHRERWRVVKIIVAATTCDGESCNMDNMLIIGFDTCDETTKQRSILINLLEECNVNEWIHDNGGGIRLRSFTV